MTHSTHLDDPRCADLVLGLLTPAERERAIAHAGSCNECALRLRRHAGAHERWRTDAGVVQGARPRRWVLPAGLAAAAGLVAVLLLPRILPAPAEHGAGPRLVAPAEGVLVREGEVEDPHLRAGFEAYAAGDLVRAERELTDARAAGTADEARRVYLAQVKLLRGDAAAALELVRSLRWDLLPSHVGRDAVGLYARALRANGRPASADSLEQALARSPEWQPLRP